MFKLQIKRFFDAAHMLPDDKSLVTKGCAGLHGHTYLVTVNITAEKNENNGMVVDFKGIKNIIDELDHTTILKDEAMFVDIEDVVNKAREQQGMKKQAFIYLDDAPTAENIGKYIYQRIITEYDFLDNVEVDIIEGYKGRDNSSSSSYAN